MGICYVRRSVVHFISGDQEVTEEPQTMAGVLISWFMQIRPKKNEYFPDNSGSIVDVENVTFGDREFYKCRMQTIDHCERKFNATSFKKDVS